MSEERYKNLCHLWRSGQYIATEEYDELRAYIKRTFGSDKNMKQKCDDLLSSVINIHSLPDDILMKLLTEFDDTSFYNFCMTKPTSLCHNNFLWFNRIIYHKLSDIKYDKNVNYKKLYERLTLLKFLKDINVAENELSELKRLEIKEVIDLYIPYSLCNLPNLSVLYISNSRFNLIPECINNLKSLQNLRLDNIRRMIKLPENISKIQSLRILTLVDLQITQLPDNIGLLNNLTELRVINCKNINDLPVSLYKLQKLEILRITDTKITSISENINKLQSLETLDLGHNKIRSIPREIGQLHLRSFSVNNNLIYRLPDSMKNLPKTCEIDVSYNRICDKPSFLRQFKSVVFKPQDKQDNC